MANCQHELFPSFRYLWRLAEKISNPVVRVYAHPQVSLKLVLRPLDQEVADRLRDDITHVTQHDLEVVVDPLSQISHEGILCCFILRCYLGWVFAALLGCDLCLFGFRPVLFEVQVVREDVVLLCFDDVLDEHARVFTFLHEHACYNIDDLWL